MSTGLGSSLNSAFTSSFGSSLNRPTIGQPSSGSSSPISGGAFGPLAALYNNLSGQFGSPFGGLGNFANFGLAPSNQPNYGTAASKLIPQVIRAPFRSMYRAIIGNNPLAG